MRQRLEPSADHPIAIDPKIACARVLVDGHIVIDAVQFLELKEANYPKVAYLPRDAADFSLLVRSDHTSWCPYKGEASYYHIKRADGSLSENAVWTYETPFPAVAAIKDALAVYAERVDGIEFS